VTDELRADGDASYLHLEREYDATPEEVWDAWTDPERLARWLARPAAAPLTAHGPVRFTFGEGDSEWADITVRESQPPHRLEVVWAIAGASSSVLRIEISAVDATRSRVVVEHRGLGDSTVGYGAGWEAYLQTLAVELGEDATVTWDERFAEVLPQWRERAAGLQRTSSATG
jgi:uncharacterized protein YndB with AHSA1/START domain